MTGRRERDCCPACGSDDIIPFAFIFGAVELYGYLAMKVSLDASYR